MSKTTLGILITVFAAFAYGLYPPTARAAYAMQANVVAVILATTWLRALAQVVFCRLKKLPLFVGGISKTNILGGFWQALSIIGIMGALQFLSGPVVILIVFTHTLMLLALLIYKKEMDFNLSILLSTIGALFGLGLVLGLWQADIEIIWAGVGLAFLSAIATFNRLYIFGKLTQNQHPIIVGAETFLMAAILLTGLLFWQMPVWPNQFIGFVWIGLSAVSLTMGTFAMFYGISLLGSFRYSLLAKLEPVFAAAFSVIFFGEHLTWQQYIGMILVLLSLAIYQYMSQAKSKAI